MFELGGERTMRANTVFKAATIVSSVALASGSTWLLVKGERDQRPAVDRQLAQTTKNTTLPSAPERETDTKAERSDRLASKVPADRAETAPDFDPMSGGPTVGMSSTTTGAASGSSSTTTGAATSAPVRRVIPVRPYIKEAADVRLRLLFKDLNDDLRQSALDVSEAKMRGQGRLALQAASEALTRTQERTELLHDLLQDPTSLVPNKATNEPSLTSGQAAGAARAVVTASAPRESGWLDMQTVIAVFGLVVSCLVMWFGDNLRERWSGKSSSTNKHDRSFSSEFALQPSPDSKVQLLPPGTPTGTSAAQPTN